MTEPVSPEVVDVLVDNHRRFLRFLEGRVGKREDAEEILQQAYVRGVERGGEIEDSERAVAWFYRLLRNAVIDHYRHRDAQRRALEREARLILEPEPMDPAVEQALCECIHGLLTTMKPDYGDLLRWVDLEGASIPEVAAQTGMTSNNTRVKLHRARAALRKQLEISCGSCTEHGCLDCTCGP